LSPVFGIVNSKVCWQISIDANIRICNSEPLRKWGFVRLLGTAPLKTGSK